MRSAIGRVGRRELLTEAPLPVHPLDRRLVAAFGDEHARVRRDRVERVVVDLAAGDDREPLVEQIHQPAHDARLRLSAFTEQDDVVAGEQRIRHLRHHGVLETDDALDQRLTREQLANRVGAELLFHLARLPAAAVEFSESGGTRHAGECTCLDSAAAPAAPAAPAAQTSRDKTAVTLPCGPDRHLDRASRRRRIEQAVRRRRFRRSPLVDGSAAASLAQRRGVRDLRRTRAVPPSLRRKHPRT